MFLEAGGNVRTGDQNPLTFSVSPPLYPSPDPDPNPDPDLDLITLLTNE